MSPHIWFRLEDSVSSVLRSSLVLPVVDQFREAVKLKFSDKLAYVDAPTLRGYKNSTVSEPLEADAPLEGLGTSE